MPAFSRNRCPDSAEEGVGGGRNAHLGTGPYAPLACSLALLEARILLLAYSTPTPVLSGTTTTVGLSDRDWAAQLGNGGRDNRRRALAGPNVVPRRRLRAPPSRSARGSPVTSWVLGLTQ